MTVMQMSDIYLDYAAATPLSEAVRAAMEPFFSQQFHNPSAQYGPAREVRASLEVSRKSVAHWLGVRPSEIIFTAGGTEADNLAIDGVMRKYPQANMVISAIEHDAIYEPAQKYHHTIAPVNPQGLIDIESICGLIDDSTVLVSVMYVNNEIGTIQPLKQLNHLLEELRKNRIEKGNTLPLLFHTDACQGGNYLSLNVHQLGVDLMTVNGGKLYGPKQSGCLYVRAGLELDPVLTGGGQEYGLRSGTENIAAISGFAVALAEAQEARHAETKRLQQLQKEFISRLQTTIPKVVINGSMKHRVPNNIHITLPGTDNERVTMALDQAGIYVAVGSACSASKLTPSRVLQAIGLDESAIRGSLRMTLGRQSSLEQIERVVASLKTLA